MKYCNSPVMTVSVAQLYISERLRLSNSGIANKQHHNMPKFKTFILLIKLMLFAAHLFVILL